MTTLRETLRTMSDDTAGVLTLDVAAISAGLVRPGGLWREVRAVAATGSSNSDLLAAAGSGAAEGTVLVAGAQTAGRGGGHRQGGGHRRRGAARAVAGGPAGRAGALV